jgi:hypothetical protein
MCGLGGRTLEFFKAYRVRPRAAKVRKNQVALEALATEIFSDQTLLNNMAIGGGFFNQLRRLRGTHE